MERIGVFVCHCGKNIAGTVNVKEVVNYAKRLEDVVFAIDNRYICSSSGQEEIKKAIRDFGLNRVVVACCTPRMHENTFRKTIEEAGLNPYLLEIANIREHCSWVHSGIEATQKAKALVRMAVAKTRHLSPLNPRKVKVIPRCLVIGGGIAGIQASLDLAEMGFEVYLVEKEPSIGGRMAQLDKTFPTMDCSICILGPKMVDAYKHDKIKVFTYSEVEGVEGYVGNFKVKIRKKARYVTEDCTGCGICAKFCPIEVPNEFDCGIGSRKAIYIPFPQAVPQIYTIDSESCIGCGLCIAVCDRNAIDFNQRDEIFEIDVGTIIVATGFDLYDVSKVKEYGYGRYKNVITSIEFERLINPSGPTMGNLVVSGKRPRRIAFIQCVGSRNEKHKKYCSRICCMYTLKHAYYLKERNPDVEVYVFYMDVRAHGKGYEEFYSKVREMGVKFVRGRPSRIFEDRDGNLHILVEDTLKGEPIEFTFDMIVLAPAIVPRADSEKIGKMLNLARSPDGFFMEAHAKLKPVDTMMSGVFLAGACQGPKSISSSVAQASAAASRAATLMSKGEIEVDPITAFVNPDLCVNCGICKDVCDFKAIDLNGKAMIKPSCYGCGACSASCPTKAIQIANFTDEQIFAQIENAFLPNEKIEPKIIAFLCNWCAYAGADTAGLMRLEYPPNVRAIRVMCSARVDPIYVLKAFLCGADGVLVAGCYPGDCHYITGNYKAKRRVEKLWNLLDEIGIGRERLRLEWISAPEGEKFARVIKEFVEDLKKIGPSPLKVIKYEARS